LADKAVSIASRYVEGSCGVVYILDKKTNKLNLISSFAYSDELSKSFSMGEGVVGQVALEKKPILLNNIHDTNTHCSVQSGTTISKPKEVFVFPLVYEEEFLGVIEIMSFNEFTDAHKEYLNKVAEIFAISLHATSQNMHIESLLEKSQQAYEELQVQSEEVQESNVQMEEQQQQLTEQSLELKDYNNSLLQAKQEIDKRAEQLEIASKYKNEFLANMSHELRTPLNSIILLSKLLSINPDKNLDEENVKKASVINKAGSELLLLINDILDLSKIESGNMEIDINAIASAEIIDDLRGLFEPIAEEKGIDFVINDRFNDTFMSDKTKLEQVLKNLLSNSFKFTKDGSVTLEIHSTDTQIIISVEDTGIGIAENKLGVIFEAFKQVDGTISREFGGTGLGLSISRSMVEHLNGYIDVQSSLGDGTKFTVMLPLDHNQAIGMKVLKDLEYDTPDSEKVSVIITDHNMFFDENKFTDKNILIVDDDSRNIFTLTSILENINAEVYSAFDGKEAIEILENKKKIDIILMDIMMPVMDGLTAIKNIKANKRFKDIPIIAITAKTMPEDKQACLDAGASDYLSKPLNYVALLSMIKAWIK
jgi:two-component system chemotaxis sensor kinase CheA